MTSINDHDNVHFLQLKDLIKQRNLNTDKSLKISSFISQLYRQTDLKSLSDSNQSKEIDIYNKITLDLVNCIAPPWQSEIAERIALDNNTPLSLIEDFIFSIENEKLSSIFIAKAIKIPKDTQIRIIDEKSTIDHKALAQRSDLSHETIEQLIGLNHLKVIALLFKNPNVSFSLINLLSLIEDNNKLLNQAYLLSTNDPSDYYLLYLLKDWIACGIAKELSAKLQISENLCEIRISKDIYNIVFPNIPSDNHNINQFSDGYLLHTLYTCQLDIFEGTLSQMLNIDIHSIQHILHDQTGELLMILFKALGYSDIIFSAIFRLLKKRSHTDEVQLQKNLQEARLSYQKIRRNTAISILLKWKENKKNLLSISKNQQMTAIAS